MSTAETVSVTFVDATTGHEFARSDLPVTQLPVSFATETTLHLGGDPWLVEQAEPLTAAEAVAAGQLVLTLRRLQSIPPQEILYSLPTICDALPPVGSEPASADSLELHEDDWRQVELVSRSLAPAVDAELDAIRLIYTDHGSPDAEGRISAFHRLHVRSIDSLAEPPHWPQLRDLLPTPARTYAGVRFRGSPTLVVDSFALGFGPLVCYGVVERDRVTVFGIHVTADGDGSVPADDSTGPTAAAVGAVLRAFDLTIVDWCRRIVADADHAAAYIRQLTQ
jgi:hypothetical protein